MSSSSRKASRGGKHNRNNNSKINHNNRTNKRSKDRSTGIISKTKGNNSNRNGNNSSFQWENLLERYDDEGSIESCISREFGPLHSPPIYHAPTVDYSNQNSNQSQKNQPMDDTKKSTQQQQQQQQRRRPHRWIPETEDETLVTYYSLHDVMSPRKVNTPTRVIAILLLLSLFCSASFYTSSIIIQTLQLQPSIAETPQEPLIPQIPVDPLRIQALQSAFQHLSPPSSWKDPQSPQSRALEWLARDTYSATRPPRGLVQRYILAVLYFSTTELPWTRDVHFMTPQHECLWNNEGGVRKCSGGGSNTASTGEAADGNVGGDVLDVSLWNNLKGTIPAELGYLSKLQVLYLARNQLYGTLPTTLGYLTDLTYLGLQHNRLNGTIPSDSFQNMRKLRTVYLEKNDFAGSIRRIDALCQLKHDAVPQNSQPALGGVLRFLTSDCRQLLQTYPPEIKCGCCTKCYLG